MTKSSPVRNASSKPGCFLQLHIPPSCSNPTSSTSCTSYSTSSFSASKKPSRPSSNCFRIAPRGRNSAEDYPFTPDPAQSIPEEHTRTLTSPEALSTGLYSYYPETQSRGMESSMRPRGGYLDYKRNGPAYMLDVDTGSIAATQPAQKAATEAGTIDPASEEVAAANFEPVTPPQSKPNLEPSAIDPTSESAIGLTSERVVAPDLPAEPASDRIISNIDPTSESITAGASSSKTEEIFTLPRWNERYVVVGEDEEPGHEKWRDDPYLHHWYDYQRHRVPPELDPERDLAEGDEKEEDSTAVESRAVSPLYELHGIDSLSHLYHENGDPFQQRQQHISPFPELTVPSTGTPYLTPHRAMLLKDLFFHPLLWLSIFAIGFFWYRVYRACIARRENRRRGVKGSGKLEDAEKLVLLQAEEGRWDVVVVEPLASLREHDTEAQTPAPLPVTDETAPWSNTYTDPVYFDSSRIAYSAHFNPDHNLSRTMGIEMALLRAHVGVGDGDGHCHDLFPGAEAGPEECLGR